VLRPGGGRGGAGGRDGGAGGRPGRAVGAVAGKAPGDRLAGALRRGGRQVDPLTGGGVTNAMTAGQLAAQVAVEAIASGDTSARFLGRYEEQWQRSAGRKMQRNYRLRERFPPAQRADERFVRASALAAGG
jgi:hypothetical protein